ncbi:MAG: fasciclin domain-containing protein [Pseudomonadota bacterium]
MSVFQKIVLSSVSSAALLFAGYAQAGKSAEAEKAMEKTTAAVEDAADAAQEVATDVVAAPEVILTDIVDTAVAAEGFNTLVAAVQAADLVDTLKSDGPFTVFAPTDEAFAALPEGTLEDLLKPENKAKLQAILTYHVLPGAVMSTDITNDMSVASVQGENLDVVLGDNGVSINNASVISADITASNGVIHVIDTVLLPAAATESR